ncbi:TnsA-like heteromeric transposase endonuclease subunit [Streptomyces mirabilis]|uniref:TnsA-like heteromeric transposase endonuclease subunit n=1 Tax=Streptomyces mirabilis TaxID=68239 RepID=UPI0021C23413|nr:TnsA-like heteromeric transposase endonuclease subunit [Streptomyces mirabilis]MCT9113779.1 TnsA-like heteromeric transposase endonuclease subunit [Streptomyces mirabilis]
MEPSERMRRVLGGVGTTRGEPLWSHRAAWDELLVPVSAEAGRVGLDLGEGWPERWTVTWKTGGDQVCCPVRDLARTPMADGDPIRCFSWRRDQRHRPGLQFMVSTGRHHGAESLEEARLLLALDFAGDLVDVVSQPMRLRFGTADKRRSHTPDFLAVTRQGVWMIDVRPESLIKEKDRESFAAAAEVALACGWHYVVVARWRDHVSSALDAFSSQRRPLSDPLGLRPALLASARQELTFGELTATATYEPLARAQLLHLLWHRRLGVDIAQPLADRSPVLAAPGAVA